MPKIVAVGPFSYKSSRSSTILFSKLCVAARAGAFILTNQVFLSYLQPNLPYRKEQQYVTRS